MLWYVLVPVWDIPPGHLGGSVSWARYFGSGHDLMVRKFKPCIGLCSISAEPALDALSPSLSAPPPLMRLHFLSQKYINIKKKKDTPMSSQWKLLILWGKYLVPKFIFGKTEDQEGACPRSQI